MAEPRIRGINFTADMALAVRTGRKTVTRRLMNPQPPEDAELCDVGADGAGVWCPIIELGHNVTREPRYQPGDLCYCKEAWRTIYELDAYPPSEMPEADPHRTIPVFYLADKGPPPKLTPGSYWGRYRHARFMPRRFARTWVEVVDVRPERIQDITPEEVLAEGVRATYHAQPSMSKIEAEVRNGLIPAFQEVWEKMHPGSWERNDWVWRHGFRLTEAP